MKSVAQLQAAGFTVQPAQDAPGCTEVLSDKPFWYYNPRFHSDMASIQPNLKPATTHGTQFRLLSAGSFAGPEQFPFVLIDDATKSSLDQAFEQHRQMQDNAKKCAATYLSTLTMSFRPAAEVTA